MEMPMSVELPGPGLITSIYDEVRDPLDDIMKISSSQSEAWCGSSVSETEI